MVTAVTLFARHRFSHSAARRCTRPNNVCGALVFLIAALVSGMCPGVAYGEWREITPAEAMCSHSVLIRLAGQTFVNAALRVANSRDTLSSVLGQPVGMPNGKGTCTILLRQSHQTDFLDARSMKKRPVVKEAVTVRCDTNGTVVEFGSHPCVVGVGWNIPADTSDSVLACVGGGGQYSPDSFQKCDLGFSLTTLYAPDEVPTSSRKRSSK
jgi:hypothetical protein